MAHSTLEQISVGTMVKIDRIDDEQMAMMAIRLGIATGEIIQVASKVPAGPMVIRRGRVDIALGRELCKSIYVSPLS